MVVRAVGCEPVSASKIPVLRIRTAKSRRRLADRTDEKRRWQRGFEQPPRCVQAQITGNLRAVIRELKDAEQGPLQKRQLNAMRVSYRLQKCYACGILPPWMILITRTRSLNRPPAYRLFTSGV